MRGVREMGEGMKNEGGEGRRKWRDGEGGGEGETISSAMTP